MSKNNKTANNEKKRWLIEPRDTLILRDGKPASGAIAMGCLPFPWPSSIAGAVRTQCGFDKNGKFILTPADARKIEVKGPWLYELDRDGKVKDVFFPAPLDCVLMENPEKDTKSEYPYMRYGLGLRENFLITGNMPDGLQPIWPLREAGLPEGKPAKGIPTFWRWSEYREWLLSECKNFPKCENFRAECALPKSFGLKPLTKETRIHVSIDPETGTAKDGALFSTESLRFERKEEDGKLHSFAIGFSYDDKELKKVKNTEIQGIKKNCIVLGGKGKISTIRYEKTKEERPPSKIPGDLLQTLGPRIRVILLTPALFENGYMPKDNKLDGAKIIAVRCERGQFISGWDMETKSPKPARRMVPAGSVYWLEFGSEKAARDWASAHWFKCISDDEQDRKDGFGLCVMGRE